MRVMIAEDSGLLRSLLADLLTSRGIAVVGLAGTKDEILELVGDDPPDVVLLDIRMPPGFRDEGLQAAKELRLRYPTLGILVLSSNAETAYTMRLLEDGARSKGYLVKDRVEDSDYLIDAINRVAEGGTVIDPDIVSQIAFRQRADDPLGKLTPSELNVLTLMAEGLSNNAIAMRASLSVKTVEKRITSIAQKLGLVAIDNGARADINVRVVVVLTYLRNAGTSASAG